MKKVPIEEVINKASAFEGVLTYHASANDAGNNGSILKDAHTGRAYCIAKAPRYASKDEWLLNAAATTHCLNNFQPLLEALKKARAGLSIASGVIEHAYGNNSMHIEEASEAVEKVLKTASFIEVQE